MYGKAKSWIRWAYDVEMSKKTISPVRPKLFRCAHGIQGNARSQTTKLKPALSDRVMREVGSKTRSLSLMSAFLVISQLKFILLYAILSGDT